MSRPRRPAAPESPPFAPGPLVLVLAAVVVAMFPVLRAGFFWDDTFYVTRNTMLGTWNGALVRAMFTQPVLGHYHPLTMATLAIDRALWGLEPFGYHLTNLLLHLANVALVYALVRRWSGTTAAAWVAALLFGIHPLRVEPVAWIASRKDVLSTALVLVSTLFYERHAEQGARRDYAACLGAFVLACLSKGSAVALALLLPLCDLRAGRPLGRGRLVRLVPFYAIAAVFGAVALWASVGTGAVVSDRGHGALGRVLYPALAFVTYLGKTVWPTGLSVFVPFPPPAAPIPAAAYAAPFVVAVLAAAAAASWRRTRVVAFGAAFYTASIMLLLRPLGGALLADRYTYLPCVGLAYLAGEGYAFLRRAPAPRAPRAARVATIAVLIVAAALGATTWSRARVWRDATSLWNDELERYPDAWAARHGRAVERAAAGDKAGAVRDLDEAIRVMPDAASSYRLRADLRADLGDTAGAAADYDASIRLDPSVPEAHFNKGYIDLERGRLDAAIASFTRALELDPRLTVAWYNRGEARARTGRLSDARADFDAALRVDPGYAPAIYGRAKAAFLLGDLEAAGRDLEVAARLGFPAEPAFRQALAGALARQPSR